MMQRGFGKSNKAVYGVFGAFGCFFVCVLMVLFGVWGLIGFLGYKVYNAPATQEFLNGPEEIEEKVVDKTKEAG